MSVEIASNLKMSANFDLTEGFGCTAVLYARVLGFLLKQLKKVRYRT